MFSSRDLGWSLVPRGVHAWTLYGLLVPCPGYSLFTLSLPPFGGGAWAESPLGTVFVEPASRIGLTGPQGLNGSTSSGYSALGGTLVPSPPGLWATPVLRGLAGARFMIGRTCSGADRLQR